MERGSGSEERASELGSVHPELELGDVLGEFCLHDVAPPEVIEGLRDVNAATSTVFYRQEPGFDESGYPGIVSSTALQEVLDYLREPEN